MSLAAGALALAAQSLLSIPCGALLFVVALAAWPGWHHQRQYALFRRRALVAGLTLAQGALRRWLWTGHLSGVAQVFVALFWATLLLAFAALLKPAHWLLLAADTLFLAWIMQPVQRRLAGQVHVDRLGLVARQWPLKAINVALLALGVMWIDFVVGAPDTRGLAWHAVAEQAFGEVQIMATCPISGWLVGALAAIDRLTWHAAQILIPSLPDQDWKLAAWALVLLHAGVLAFSFTDLLLGVAALAEGHGRRTTVGRGDGAHSRIFVLTLLVLTLPYLYATSRLSDFNPDTLGKGVRELLARTNPCRSELPALNALQSGLDSELRKAHLATTQFADQQIDQTLDALFAEVEQGVESYLDWYFTVLGEYQRLGALATGQLPALMNAELERRLFGDIKFDEKVESASSALASETQARLSLLSDDLAKRIRTEFQDQPCQLAALNLSALGNLDRDRLRASLAASGGVAVGVASVSLLARKTSSTVVGKVAGKKAFQFAASLSGKVAARRTGSILLSAAGATAICAPAGPLATLCGIGAGAVAWLAFDKALIKIDEIRFREEMRDGILASVREQKVELASALRPAHFASLRHRPYCAGNQRRAGRHFHSCA
jgi:hypothetical protein